KARASPRGPGSASSWIASSRWSTRCTPAACTGCASIPSALHRFAAACSSGHARPRSKFLVGASEIEPPTTTMSRWCSTPELRAYGGQIAGAGTIPEVTGRWQATRHPRRCATALHGLAIPALHLSRGRRLIGSQCSGADLELQLAQLIELIAQQRSLFEFEVTRTTV